MATEKRSQVSRTTIELDSLPRSRPNGSFLARPNEVPAKWWLIDAEGQTVGRMATQIADLLRGKRKVTFTPHVDSGDFVVVINADKVKFTGNKWQQKIYYRHSRFFGSLKETTAEEMREKSADQIVVKAVKNMLQKNKLAHAQIQKLKVYAGGEHPHAAQKPEFYPLAPAKHVN